MRLKDLLDNTNIVSNNADLDLEIAGVSSDTSIIRPGELFVAIEGYKSDGHDYIEDAVKKGASCVICQRKPNISTPYIIVEDSRKALSLISAAWFGYPARKMKLIGVTGTGGKTTVTYLIKHIIEKCTGCKVGLIGTIANLIDDRELKATLTTPDSYELQSILDKMALEGCTYVVMEVSSHALCLSRVYGIDYEIGIFTNLTPEHLDFHPTMDDYANAKAMLFRNCRTGIINIDDKYSSRMLEACNDKTVTFGVSSETADLQAKNIQLKPAKTEFDVQIGNKTSRIKIHIPGMFTVYNTLSAIAAGISLGFEHDDIAKALTTCSGVNGRAEVLPINKEYTIMVDYAHKPDALENIIKTARMITTGRVITLFGCGGDRDKTKRPVMGKIAAELSDIVFVTTDNPRTENPRAIIDEILEGIAEKAELSKNGRLKVVENRREAIRQALDMLLMGDMLLIAGKGHETYQIVGTEKTYFDDREVVYEFLTNAG